MGLTQKNLKRNKYKLSGTLRKNGYDRWRFFFTASNAVTGADRPFFVEYFIVNPALSPRAVIFGKFTGRTPVGNQLLRPAYVMVKAGCYGPGGKQINAFYPCEKLVFAKKELDLRIGECSMTELEIKGSVTMTENHVARHPEYLCDAGTIEWNLQIDKQISWNPGCASSGFARVCNMTEMHSHFQGIKAAFSGTISVDGVNYTAVPQTSYGYADKFWGRQIPSPWMWLSCCNISSIITGKRLTDSCFTVTGCYSRLFRIPLAKKMIIFATVDGKKYEFNFAKFWHHSKVVSQCVETGTSLHWTISAHERRYILDIDVFCNTDDMLLRSYETADEHGKLARILSGGNGTGELRIYRKVKKNLELIEHARIRNVGCEYGELETEENAAGRNR